MEFSGNFFWGNFSRGFFFGGVMGCFFSDCWWDLMDVPTVGFYDGFKGMFLDRILRDFSMGIDDDTMQSSGI